MSKWKGGRSEGKRYRELKREYNGMCERKKKEESDRWIEVARNAETEGHVLVNRKKKRR